jgi:hypothetical protein
MASLIAPQILDHGRRSTDQNDDRDRQRPFRTRRSAASSSSCASIFIAPT